MFLLIILIIVILYLYIHKHIEGFKEDDYKNDKRCLVCYYGGAFREGNIGSTISDTNYGYESQENTSKTHAKLKSVLNEKGYQTDILINTRNTKYKDKLESWYNPFNIVINNLSNKIHGKDYMIQSTIENINKINKYDYDFILFIRIDLFLKPDFYKILNTEIDKISFLSNNFDPRTCINTKKGNPEANDLFILIPKNYYYILDKYFKLNHDSLSYLKTQYNLQDSDFAFMTNKMFDSNSALDQNPFYLMSSRKENKEEHMNKTFETGLVTKTCPEYKQKNQTYLENPTQYYLDKYETFYNTNV